MICVWTTSCGGLRLWSAAGESVSVSVNESGEDHVGRESETEQGRGTERGSGTKKGDGIAGDSMMSHPVKLQGLLFCPELVYSQFKVMN